MRHLVAIVACLAVSGSIASAGSGNGAGRRGKVALAEEVEGEDEIVFTEEEVYPEVRDRRRGEDGDARGRRWRDEDDDGDGERGRRWRDDDDDDGEDEVEYRRGRWRDEQEDDDDQRIGRWGDDGGEEIGRWGEEEEEARWRDDGERDERRARRRGRAGRPKPWHIAFGPYLWASSVDANVSLGSASVSTGVDFMEIKRHARYGFSALLEARYGRFSVYGDMTYGVVGLDGEREVGPFMVKLAGTASSLMIDSAAGYRVVGADPQAWLSLEARVGLRYQRTAIDGAVNVAGADVSNPSYVDGAADGLAGGQVVLRPLRRLALSGTFDLGVVGASTKTWSAAADASWRISKRVLLSAGWRTMTTDRPNVSIVMHGPRGALQLMF